MFQYNSFVFQNNIGHKLLLKQGWQAGQGLGKQLQGKTHSPYLPLNSTFVTGWRGITFHLSIFVYFEEGKVMTLTYLSRKMYKSKLGTGTEIRFIRLWILIINPQTLGKIEN